MADIRLTNSRSPRGRTPRRFALFLLLSLCLIGIDQLTKFWVTQTLAYGTAIYVTSFFNLCHVVNTGAAFSFLGEAGGWQIFLFSGFALIVSAAVIWMLYKHNDKTLLSLCLAAVLAGAVGNLIDRMLLGHVVDFLDFHFAGWHWPAFNVADIAVCTGAFGAVALEFFEGKHH